ncbi:MAG: DUF58 domain-containing protein [Planctomycetota bacterium]
MSNWFQTQFRTFRRVYIWWRDQLTIVGKMIFLVMIGSLPTFADSGAVLAIVFIASSTILLVAAAASFLFRPRLSVRATCPNNWMCRESRVVPVRITNRSRFPVYELRLDMVSIPGVWEIVEAEAFVKVLKPGETITVSLRVKALRRGEFQLPELRATTSFPLNLRIRSKAFPVRRQALILPFYRELRSFDLLRFMPNLVQGQDLALQTVGLTGEYVGSREYQPGLAVRKWDYASWARLGRPVVREFSEPRYPSVAVIVDTFFPTWRHERGELVPELEATLSLAAAVTEALVAHGYRLSMLTIGKDCFTSDCRFSSENHVVVLERLALGNPCHLDGLKELAGRLEHSPTTWDLAIVLSHRWESEQEELFQLATRRNASGRRVLVQLDEQVDEQAHADADPGFGHRVTASQIEAGQVDL